MALVLCDSLENGVVKITLNDPDNLNAMGEQMAAEFVAVINSLKSRVDSIRAVILTGAGRAFSAGGHLEMLEKKRTLTGEQNRLLMHQFYRSFLSILELRTPIIAALNGPAIGAGLCLATACDIRIAADTAKLGFTFSRLGLHPGMGATYFLPRVLGFARASELLLTGRVVVASEALRLGLVSQVVLVNDVMSTALSIAQEIGLCGPEAIRQLLENLRVPGKTLDESLEREALAQSINYAGKEFAEGLAATREKRAARF